MMELPSVGMQALFAGGGGRTSSSFRSPWSFVWSVTSTVPAAFTVMLPVSTMISGGSPSSSAYGFFA